MLNTPSSLRNTPSSNIAMQQPSQASVSRSNLPTRRSNAIENRRASTLTPSSASGHGSRHENLVSTNRLSAYSKPQDPRPIRSHRFQAKVQDDLYDYLSTNKFDIEMKVPLSLKTLKNPTQKEFNLIFQWLYKKLDPGYKFNRSIEQDIYTLLRFLEYPYLDTINKSQISAVGGSNWPIFLGMLHWLLTLVKESTKLDDLDLDSIQESQPSRSVSDSINDSVVSGEQSVLNKLFISYALKSYKAFLSVGEDDYSIFYDEMQSDYKKYIEQIERKSDLNSESNDNLQATLNSLKEKYNLFYDELDRSSALKTDVSKFQTYIDSQKQRQTKWSNIIDKAKTDINNIKESIKNINKEKQDIISDLERKQLTLKDIEELHIERAKLTANLNLLDSNQKSANASIDTKLTTLKSQFGELQATVNAYNSLVYQILNNLNLPNSPDVPSLALTSIDEEYHTSKLGAIPSEIIPGLSTLRVSLNDLRSKIQSEVTKLQDETLQLQDQLDDAKLSIVSQTDKLEDLEGLLSKSRKEYSDLNEKYTFDSSYKQIEIEERAKEMRLFNLQNTEKKKSIENKWKETQNEYKKVISNTNEHKTQLLLDIAQCLDTVVNFKSDIMTDLENITMEVNQELKQHSEILASEMEES